jgi:hypothetical protein
MPAEGIKARRVRLEEQGNACANGRLIGPGRATQEEEEEMYVHGAAPAQLGGSGPGEDQWFFC